MNSLTAKEIGEYPANEMTIRQKMAMEFVKANIIVDHNFASREERSSKAVRQADSLLEELANG